MSHSPGISGRAQPSTFLEGMSIAFIVLQVPLCKNKSTIIIAEHKIALLSSQ